MDGHVVPLVAGRAWWIEDASVFSFGGVAHLL
jgi:hypothetical protein